MVQTDPEFKRPSAFAVHLSFLVSFSRVWFSDDVLERSSRTAVMMYATRTTFAAAIAVIAAKVGFPANISIFDPCEVLQCVPSQTYFNDRKYDPIGKTPRVTLKIMSFNKTPLLKSVNQFKMK